MMILIVTLTVEEDCEPKTVYKQRAVTRGEVLSLLQFQFTDANSARVKFVVSFTLLSSLTVTIRKTQIPENQKTLTSPYSIESTYAESQHDSQFHYRPCHRRACHIHPLAARSIHRPCPSWQTWTHRLVLPHRFLPLTHRRRRSAHFRWNQIKQRRKLQCDGIHHQLGGCVASDARHGWRSFRSVSGFHILATKQETDR
jgi:hypothetical protein